MLNKKIKRAFTLAEILVTLGILGVLGLLTVGLLRGNTAELEQKVARAKLMDSVSTALATMQLDGKIAGYANTTAFANEFQKYYGVNKVLNGADAQEVLNVGKEAGAIKSADAGEYFVFTGDGGATVALSYNKNGVANGQFTESGTVANRGVNDITYKNSALSFVDGFYDVNGIDNGSNALGKDIGAIAPYDANTAQCEGNKIPVSGGGCVCSITANECLALGKKLDSKNCICTGEVSCQMGKTYNETTKKCECPVESRDCDSVYSVFDEATCTCKVDLKTQLTCKANGGTWNATKGTCECLPAEDENSCESKYHGYASADQADYCKCKCKSAKDINALVTKNASGKGDLTAIKKYTLASDDLAQECYVCGTPTTTAFNIKKADGVCAPESKYNPEDCVGAGFLEWQGYDPKDEEHSYYCKCVLTQAKCDNIYKNAMEAQYGAGFVPRDNYCWGKSSNGETSCRYNVDKCRENPKSAECRNTTNQCWKSGKSKPTSTHHFSCAWSSVKNGKLVATSIAGTKQHATKNSCYCAPQNGTVPSGSSWYREFHCSHGICEANRFYPFTTYDVNNISGANLNNEIVSIKNAVIFERYTYAYDPIILNVGASNVNAAPEATNEINTQFTNEENEPVTTAWLKQQLKPEFYFLVNDKNKNGQVDNLNDLYHEAGGNYFTGLDMLKAEGFTFAKTDSGETSPIITYPQLANKGLKAWADMNANAKVDGAESLVDLLKLQASEIVYTVDEKQTEAVEIPNPDFVEGDTAPQTITVTRDVIKPIQKIRKAFTDISGLGVFEINTDYVAVSEKDGDGRPQKLGHETIAIQGRYTILTPVSSLDSSKYWIEMVPVSAGTNPEIKYVAKDSLSGGVAAGEEVYRATTVSGLNWTETFRDAAGSEIRAGKDIGIFLKVEKGSSVQYYELKVRGLTDVIFEAKH